MCTAHDIVVGSTSSSFVTFCAGMWVFKHALPSSSYYLSLSMLSVLLVPLSPLHFTMYAENPAEAGEDCEACICRLVLRLNITLTLLHKDMIYNLYSCSCCSSCKREQHENDLELFIIIIQR